MRSRSLSEHTDLPLPGRPGASAGARHSRPSWAGFDAELVALRVLHHCVTGMAAHDGRSQTNVRICRDESARLFGREGRTELDVLYGHTIRPCGKR